MDPKILLDLEMDRWIAFKVQQTVVAHHYGESAASVNHGGCHFKRAVIVFQSQCVHRILALQQN